MNISLLNNFPAGLMMTDMEDFYPAWGVLSPADEVVQEVSLVWASLILRQRHQNGISMTDW